MFLGCTNYKPDGSSCNRMMTYTEYKKISNRFANTN